EKADHDRDHHEECEPLRECGQEDHDEVEEEEVGGEVSSQDESHREGRGVEDRDAHFELLLRSHSPEQGRDGEVRGEICGQEYAYDGWGLEAGVGVEK